MTQPETPRTDAKVKWCDQSERDNGDFWPREEFIHFARQLERELAACESRAMPQPCCGEYFTCHRVCTPRGVALGKREAEAVDRNYLLVRQLAACHEAIAKLLVEGYGHVIQPPAADAPDQRGVE